MSVAVYGPDGSLLGLQKSLLAIYTELAAIPAKHAAIWAAFTAGSPPVWSLIEGVNAGAIGVIAYDTTIKAVSASFTAAEQLYKRLMMVAMYVQEKPLALVNPAFDPTIDVKGYVPIV